MAYLGLFLVHGLHTGTSLPHFVWLQQLSGTKEDTFTLLTFMSLKVMNSLLSLPANFGRTVFIWKRNCISFSLLFLPKSRTFLSPFPSTSLKLSWTWSFPGGILLFAPVQTWSFLFSFTAIDSPPAQVLALAFTLPVSFISPNYTLRIYFSLFSLFLCKPT